MSAPVIRDNLNSSTPLWRVALNWAMVAAVVVGLIVLIGDLGSRLRAKSFAVVYPENAALNTVLAILGILVAVLVTSYIGKLLTERVRLGRKASYPAILTDQLTHVFFWIVILFSLYPIFYVLSSSIDPLNRLTQATLGPTSEPLLIRARVIPSIEGSDLSNYARLFEGVVVYNWQWILLGLAVLGVLGLAVVWALVQLNQGVVSKFHKTLRLVSTWVALIAGFGFFALLSAGQFTGFSNASKFLLWVRNTFLVSGITSIITVLLCTTAGYALARLRFPGRFELLMFLIFIQMFPSLLALVAVYEIISRLGLINSLPGLIIAYTGGAISFGTWMYKGFVESLPPSLEEAALVDGCTRWTAFTKIVLPLSGPMLVFIFLLQFVGTYTEFYLANVILSGAENWNVGVGLRSFATGQFSVAYGTFAAAAVLGALPIVILYYSFQQVFISGNLAGGVKE